MTYALVSLSNLRAIAEANANAVPDILAELAKRRARSTLSEQKAKRIDSLIAHLGAPKAPAPKAEPKAKAKAKPAKAKAAPESAPAQALTYGETQIIAALNAQADALKALIAKLG